MKRSILYNILFSVLIFLMFTTNAIAVTTTISNLPQSINSEPFTFKVNVSGANVGINYLKIDLFKASTSNYFGETFNGLGWYKEDDYTQYYSINIESGTDWSGEIQGRIGSPSSIQYDSPGTYKLRVRRYTSSGNYNATEANNSAIDLKVEGLIPTSTQNPTSSSSPIPSESSEELISPNPTDQPQTFSNVYISEVMIDPETGTNEWIEVYNANEFEINLDEWFIDDLENSGSTPKMFTLIIPAKAYLSYDLSGSIFNNGGDSVRLLDFNQKEIDSFQYNSAEKGKTLGRSSFDTDTFCLQNPSKNNPNSTCINPPASTIKASSTTLPTSTIAKTESTTITVTQAILKTTPIKFPLVNQSIYPLSKTPEKPDEEVLGTSTENKKTNNSKRLIPILTFVSSSYSLLSIISIIYRVKINT